MSETIIVAVISASSALIISLIGAFVAKIYKIGPNQDKLVQTLKDLLNAQDKKIEDLQSIVEKSKQEILDNHKKLLDLTEELEILKNLTVSQAILIEELQKKLGGRHA